MNHLVEDLSHIVVDNAFVRIAASIASAAVADIFFTDENFFNNVTGIACALCEFVAQVIGVVSLTRTARQN